MTFTPKDYFYIFLMIIALSIAFKQRYRLKFLETFLNGKLSKNPFNPIFTGNHNGIDYIIKITPKNGFLIGGNNLTIKLKIKVPVSFSIYRKGIKPFFLDLFTLKVNTGNPDIDEYIEIRMNNEKYLTKIKPTVEHLYNLIRIGFHIIKSDEYSLTLIKTIKSDDEANPELLKPALDEIYMINQKLTSLTK